MNIIYDIFSYLMKGCLYISGNHYILALFFFALVMEIVLLPLAIKQQKSQIQMAKIKPKEMAIREKYKGRRVGAPSGNLLKFHYFPFRIIARFPRHWNPFLHGKRIRIAPKGISFGHKPPPYVMLLRLTYFR